MGEQYLADSGAVQRQPGADRADDGHRRPSGEPFEVEDLVPVADGQVHGGERRRIHVVEERDAACRSPVWTGASRPTSHIRRPMA